MLKSVNELCPLTLFRNNAKRDFDNREAIEYE